MYSLSDIFHVPHRLPPPPSFPPPPPSFPTNSPLQVKHAYEPQNSDELPLRVGHRLRVTQAPEGGWWHATDLGSRASGWFPASHVVIVQPEPAAAKLQSAAPKVTVAAAATATTPASAKLPPPIHTVAGVEAVSASSRNANERPPSQAQPAKSPTLLVPMADGRSERRSAITNAIVTYNFEARNEVCGLELVFHFRKISFNTNPHHLFPRTSYPSVSASSCTCASSRRAAGGTVACWIRARSWRAGFQPTTSASRRRRSGVRPRHRRQHRPKPAR